MKYLLLPAFLLASIAPVAAQTAVSGAASVRRPPAADSRQSRDTQPNYWLSRDLNGIYGKFRAIKLH